MAAKRARTVDSPPPHSAKPGDDEAMKSAKPVYLVAPRTSTDKPSHSVFMVDTAAVTAVDDDDGRKPRRRRARAVAELPSGGASSHAKSFVAAHSEQGSWILGAGGTGGTVIHDPSTAETLRGPELTQPKREPVLLFLGGKVYAISRCPSVHDSEFDFEPWFESLSFRKGPPSIYRNDLPHWKALPSPPCFPCFLDPVEYRNPPRVWVSSYAAVAASSHILISLEDNNEAGTWAFHVVKKAWEKVCDEGLPFVCQAAPLGGSLFVACYTTNNTDTSAAIFRMSISGSSGKLTTSLLSILKCPPVASVGDPLPLFSPMGKGSFCSTWLGPSCQIRKASSHAKKGLKIILTTFKIDNFEDILTACETECGVAKDLQVQVQVTQQKYKLHGASLSENSPMPVIAPLAMVGELAELFQGKKIKKRVRDPVASNIFEAFVIWRT
ncbi:hypothetical protein EJB05_29134, partial [Eragrostis curvula]